MAYLLRFLILLMALGMGLTVLRAMNFIFLPLGHISLGIVSFLYMLFVQALVMFYFIGVGRLMRNIYDTLLALKCPGAEEELKDLFGESPENLSPYLEKTGEWVRRSTLCRRQTVPWTMLMLSLGTLAFLLGAAHDTGLVAKTTHLGVVYGFIFAMLIGFFRQWHYLKICHGLLRKAKTLYQIPDSQM